MATVATGTAFGVARTVELTAFDDATHTATLTIGPGEGKMADTKYLFAAYDNADRGTNPTNWAKVCYIRTIYAATTNETHVWTLPEEWHNDSGALRFFLVQPVGPRVQEGMYLSSHGIGTTANLNGGSHLVFIDTGIKPTTQTETILDVGVYHYNDSAPFGLKAGYYLFSNGDAGQTHSRFFDNVGTYSFKYNATGDDGVHQLRLGPSGTFIDGERLMTHSIPQYASYNDNIWLFARNNPSQAGNLTTTDPVTLTNVITGCKMRHCMIYSAQIITNGVLARSFTPRKVNNVPMMWDSVTQTAFGNSAPGSVQQFGWGETHVTLTNGTSETCSATRIFTRQISRMNVDSRLKKVTLTLGGDSKRCVLYAVRGQEDLGAASDPAAWDDLILIGKIPAGVATYEATLPAEWWRAGGYARFLLKGSAAYDWPLESLSSTGEGSYRNDGHNGPDDQGYQYIDTGIVPTKNTTTSVRINVPKNIDMASFGIGSVYYLFSTSVNMNWCFSSAGNAQGAGYASSAIPKTDGNDHTYTLGPGGALVDGTSYATFSHITTLTSAKSISLFARRAGSTSDEFGKFGPCTMYWATIDEGNERVRDFIPVEKDGLGYMYDKVTRKLFGNVNTSYGTAANGGTPVPFVKGAPIVSLASSDVLAVSDHVALSRGVQIIFR